MIPTRGVVYMIFDKRPLRERSNGLPPGSYINELNYSSRWAGEVLKLPVTLMAEQDMPLKEMGVDLSNFNSIQLYDASPFHDPIKTNGFLRKLYLYDWSPYDETLYLDTDAFPIGDEHPVNPDYPHQPPPDITGFEYPFRMASAHGLAMAHDSFQMGRLEKRADGKVFTPYPAMFRTLHYYLPGCEHIPLFNGGVIFFRKGFPGLKEVVDVARSICHSMWCDDQLALTVAAELRRFTIFPLAERVWNCRDFREPHFLPWWGVRILHNPQWFRNWLLSTGERK